jgi:hypothetical protein
VIWTPRYRNKSQKRRCLGHCITLLICRLCFGYAPGQDVHGFSICIHCRVGALRAFAATSLINLRLLETKYECSLLPQLKRAARQASHREARRSHQSQPYILRTPHQISALEALVCTLKTDRETNKQTNRGYITSAATTSKAIAHYPIPYYPRLGKPGSRMEHRAYRL